jgi:hypothetical protein
MSTKKRKPKLGRPPLPEAERSARILSVRLLPRDQAMLEALASRTGLSDAVIMRVGLVALSTVPAAQALLLRKAAQ